MTRSPNHNPTENGECDNTDATQRLVELLEHIRSRNIRMVLLLEWLMPQQGRLTPMKRDGKPIIARIPFTVDMLRELISGSDIVEKLWAMNHRFGYNSISLPPAKIRARLDYMVEGDTKLPVQDKGVVCDASGLANGHTVPVRQVTEHLITKLCELFDAGLKPGTAEILGAMRKLNVGGLQMATEENRLGLLYEGSDSMWLNDRFESIFNPLRVAPDPTKEVVVILSTLWNMLDHIVRPARLSLKSALRPMHLKPNMSLAALPRFYEIKEPVQEALFMWTTESIPQQVEGHVSIAPQTRFGWCSRDFVVVLDYRMDRTDPQLDILPTCHLVAIDRSRELGYLVSLEQLDDHTGVEAKLRIVELRSPDHISTLMTLTNIRFDLPFRFDPEIEDNGLTRALYAPLPYWMGSSHAYSYEILNLSDLYRMRFRFRMIPEQFDEVLLETMTMFYEAAMKGFRMRVRTGPSDTEGTLLEIKHPAQAGIGCINELEGMPLNSVSWLWIKWMMKAFSMKATSPWHVLAWRFVENACRAGLCDYFARKLWRLDKHMASVMFGQRTVMAHRDGAVIPVLRYPYSLEKGYDSGAVMNLPARMLGRRLTMTQEQYLQHVVGFDSERFALMHGASQSLLQLIVEES